MSENPEIIKLSENTIKEKKHKEKTEEKLKEKNENEEKSVSYFQLQYKFADKFDYILILIATFGSIIAGAAMPLISLLLGAAINNFGPKSNISELKENVKTLAINFVVCGIGILLGSFVMFFFWSLVSKRLIQKINTAYFEVLLKQEQGYFDQREKNEHFVTKINQEIKTIENGVKIFI
jgi:ATP-binding cassette subfamily B (MDR/TAP) protein 1